jgi:hypothetical protein
MAGRCRHYGMREGGRRLRPTYVFPLMLPPPPTIGEERDSREGEIVLQEKASVPPPPKVPVLLPAM